MKRNTWAALAAILVLVVILTQSLWMPTGRENGTVSVNASGDGLSSAYGFLQKKYPDRVYVKRSAFLDGKELAKAAVVLLLSPKMYLSSREELILKKYVENGGVIFVSAHDALSTTNLRSLIDLFGFSKRIKENLGYTAEHAQHVLNHEDGLFIKKDETYAFYSQTSLNEECTQPAMYCFTENLPYGKGRIILWLGLAPFTNGLIGLDQNLEIFSRVLDRPGQIVFDEYHHLYSDMSVADLVRRPDFMISIVSFLVAGLVYLIFAKPPELEVLRDEHARGESRLSFYRLYANVFARQLETKASADSTLKQHAKWVGVPETEVSSSEGFLQAASRLVRRHKRLLQERKGL